MRNTVNVLLALVHLNARAIADGLHLRCHRGLSLPGGLLGLDLHLRIRSLLRTCRDADFFLEISIAEQTGNMNVLMELLQRME